MSGFNLHSSVTAMPKEPGIIYTT